MTPSAIDSTFIDAPPVLPTLLPTATSPQMLALTNETIESASDSWIDEFVHHSEAGFATQLNNQLMEQAETKPIPTPALPLSNHEVQIAQRDPLTGSLVDTNAVQSNPVIQSNLIQADISQSPAYPGYALSYTPGLALENRPAVAQWQAQMQQRGWTIEVDGLFGPQSDRIVRQFQLEKGLIVDGIVGPETWRVAFDNSTITGIDDPPEVIAPPPTQSEIPAFTGNLLSYSSFTPLRYDSEVQTFQQRLQALGWRLDADGIFGPNSASVTRAFQRQVGLAADGIVGALTWAAVFAEDAPIAPAEQTVSPPGSQRPINETGLNLIRDFEGRRLNAYQDAVGVWTIGYGHTRTAYPGQRITEAGATALLREDVATFERAVSQAVRVPLTDNQYAALVSFAFNVGSGALNSSTLLRRLNAGDYYGAANELLRWNRAGGRELYGLTRRREAERSLFLS